MRTRTLCVSSVVGAALFVSGLAGSASAASVQLFSTTVSIPAGKSGKAVRACKSGKVVGGGWMLNGTSMKVFKNVMNGNGWEIDAFNNSAAADSITVYVNCLIGAPKSWAVSTKSTSAKVTIGTAGILDANCGSGQIVLGGGFTTTVGAVNYGQWPIMRVYFDGRDVNRSASWAVSGYNGGTSGDQNLTAYAYCISNKLASTVQAASTVIDRGLANAICDSGLTVAGGYYYPSDVDETLTQVFQNGPEYTNIMLPEISSGAGAYAECMTLK
jgi:hypothetical protein